MISNTLIRLFGYNVAPLIGNPTIVDRLNWLRRHLLPGPLRTLDAGCGSGYFTFFASLLGNESLGITSDAASINAANARAELLKIKNARFVAADLRELKKISTQLGVFDQIICFEVIEHILNDKKLLADLSLLLKPGGVFLLTTPYKHHKKLFDEKLSSYEDGGHVRYGYTFEEIRTLFQEFGLEITEEEFISGLISQQLSNLTGLLNKINIRISWLVTFPLRIFQIFDKPLSKLFKYPYLSIAVVGIKR